jgi:hypothetical protein
MDWKPKHLLFRHKNGRQAGLGAQCIVVDNDSLRVDWILPHVAKSVSSKFELVQRELMRRLSRVRSHPSRWETAKVVILINCRVSSWGLKVLNASRNILNFVSNYVMDLCQSFRVCVPLACDQRNALWKTTPLGGGGGGELGFILLFSLSGLLLAIRPAEFGLLRSEIYFARHFSIDIHVQDKKND